MRGFVSIGMPVYNDRQFLTLALDSLLAQSHSNFELIISDDGSTDGSEVICRQYAARDSRIRYFRQPQNLGISQNMMFLLKAAAGEYFMWAANDDLWHRDFVTTLREALQQNPDAVSAFTPMLFIDEQGEQLADPAPRATDYSAPTPSVRLRKLIAAFDDAFGYGMFRRDAITGVQFPIWWWVNRERAYNNIYPTLCFYLARGDFVLAGDVPMWFNRLKNQNNIHHKNPFADRFVRGYFAFLLWKFNLVLVSLKQIARAGEWRTAIFVSPAMFLRWFFLPAVDQFVARASLLIKRKIYFF